MFCQLGAGAARICICALLSACQSRYRLIPGVSMKQSHRGKQEELGCRVKENY